MKDTAIKYLLRLWNRKSTSPSKQKIATLVGGVGDYRTIDGWIRIWPEIEEQAKRESSNVKKGNNGKNGRFHFFPISWVDNRHVMTTCRFCFLLEV